MSNNALASMFGGIGDFVVKQRGFQEETAENKRKQEAHALQQALTTTQHEIAKENLAYLPTQREQQGQEHQIRTFGEILAPEQERMIANAPPAQQAALRRHFQEAANRRATSDRTASDEGRRVAAVADIAQTEVPIAKGKAATFQSGTQYLAANPNADPLTDRAAAQAYADTGRTPVVTHAQTRKERLEEIDRNNASHLEGIRLQARLQQDARRETLLPGTNPSTDNMVRGSINSFEKVADSAADDITRLDQTVYAQILRWHQQKGRRGIANDAAIQQELARLRATRAAKVEKIRQASKGTANVATSLHLEDQSLHQYINSQMEGALARLPAEPAMYTDPDALAVTAGVTPGGGGGGAGAGAGGGQVNDFGFGTP